mgnify:CR=1 FL=1
MWCSWQQELVLLPLAYSSSTWRSTFSCTLLEHVQVPLDGISSCCCVNSTTQLSAISKLAMSLITVMKSTDHKMGPWGTPSDWPPAGHNVTDHNPLAQTIQPILYPPNSTALNPSHSNSKTTMRCRTISKARGCPSASPPGFSSC